MLFILWSLQLLMMAFVSFPHVTVQLAATNNAFENVILKLQ